MKTIGLIGGMSWESTLEYYRLINEAVKTRLGGLHSAKCLLLSVDFAEIELLQRQARWAEAGQILAQAAKDLQNGGADFIVLCTNTMHKLAGEIQAAVDLPFLHIADAAGAAVQAAGIRKIGLLGTRFTMEEDFYTARLTRQYGLEVLVPDAPERKLVDRVIFEELVLGQIRPESKAAYLAVIAGLAQRGAQGVILGCTEIGLLVQSGDCQVPLFDTTRIHAEAAAEFSLSAEKNQ